MKKDSNHQDPLQRKNQIKKYAKELRQNMTPGEVRTWSMLKNHLLKFNRQFRIGEYIVDFACQELKLVIEIDGISHDYDDNKGKKDLLRQSKLEEQGWSVVRFREEDVVRKDNFFKYPDVLGNTINNFMEIHGLTYEELEKRKAKINEERAKNREKRKRLRED